MDERKRKKKRKIEADRQKDTYRKTDKSSDLDQRMRRRNGHLGQTETQASSSSYSIRIHFLST